MDITLYEQQIEELNRKLMFQRSRYLKDEYEHYHITDMQYSVLSYIQQHPGITIGLSQRPCIPMPAICPHSAKGWSEMAISTAGKVSGMSAVSS